MGTISYYAKRGGKYYLHVGNEIRYIGEKIAIGFTTRSGYKKTLLHKHGSIESVTDWFDRSVTKIIQADAPDLAENVKMLVLSDIDSEEINRMTYRPEYLEEWIKNNDIKL